MIFASILLAVSPVQVIAADDDISSGEVSPISIPHRHVASDIVHVSNPVVQALPVVAEVEDELFTKAAFARPAVRSMTPAVAVSSSAVSSPAAPPAATLSHSEVNCLAMAVYFEARGEPASGQKAVADVIMNRKKRRGLSSTCAVVNQKGQFSGRSRWKPSSGPVWDRAVKIARESLSGLTHISSSIQFFHSARVAPNWGRKVAMRIGAHIFY